MIGFVYFLVFSFLSSCGGNEVAEEDASFLSPEETDELLKQTTTIVNQTVGQVRHEVLEEVPGTNCVYGGYKIVIWSDLDPEDGSFNAEIDSNLSESYTCFNVPSTLSSDLSSLIDSQIQNATSQNTLVRTTSLSPVPTCATGDEGLTCCRNGGTKITTWLARELEPPLNDIVNSRLVCNGKAGLDAVGNKGFLLETVNPWSMGAIPDEVARGTQQTTCQGFVTSDLYLNDAAGDTARQNLADCWSSLLTEVQYLGSTETQGIDCTNGGLRFTTWSEHADLFDGVLIPPPATDMTGTQIKAYLDDARTNAADETDFLATVDKVRGEVESREVRYLCNVRPIFNHILTYPSGDPIHGATCPTGGRLVTYGYPSYQARFDNGDTIPPTNFILSAGELADPSLIIESYHACNPGDLTYVSFGVNVLGEASLALAKSSLPLEYEEIADTTAFSDMYTAHGVSSYCGNGGRVLAIWQSYSSPTGYDASLDAEPSLIPICNGADGSTPAEYITEIENITPGTTCSQSGTTCVYGGMKIRTCRATGSNILDVATHAPQTCLLDPNVDSATLTEDCVCHGSSIGLDFTTTERDGGNAALFTSAGCNDNDNILITYQLFKDIDADGVYGGSDVYLGSPVTICTAVDGETPTPVVTSLSNGNMNCTYGGHMLEFKDSSNMDIIAPTFFCNPAVIDFTEDVNQRFVVSSEYDSYKSYIEQCHGPGLVYELQYSDGSKSPVPICWGVGSATLKKVARNVSNEPDVGINLQYGLGNGLNRCPNDSTHIDLARLNIKYGDDVAATVVNFGPGNDAPVICVRGTYSSQTFSGIREFKDVDNVSYTGIGSTGSETVLSQVCPGGGVLMVPYYNSNPDLVDVTHLFALCNKVDVADPLLKDINTIDPYTTVDGDYNLALQSCPYGGQVYRISYNNSTDYTYFGVCSGGLPGTIDLLPSGAISGTYADCIDDSLGAGVDFRAMQTAQCNTASPANHTCFNVTYQNGTIGRVALCDIDHASVFGLTLMTDKADPNYDSARLAYCSAGGSAYEIVDAGSANLGYQALCHYYEPYQRIVDHVQLTGGDLTAACPRSPSGFRIDICLDYDADGTCQGGTDVLLKSEVVCANERVQVLTETVPTDDFLAVASDGSGTAAGIAAGSVTTHLDGVFAFAAGNVVYEANPCTSSGGTRFRSYYDVDQTLGYNAGTDEWVWADPTYSGSWNFHSEPSNQARWSYACNGSGNGVSDLAFEKRVATYLECPSGGEVLMFCSDTNGNSLCSDEDPNTVTEVKVCNKGAPGPLFKDLVNISEGDVAGLRWSILGIEDNPSYTSVKLAYSNSAHALNQWNPVDASQTPPPGVTVLTQKSDCLRGHSVPEFNQLDKNVRLGAEDYCAIDLVAAGYVNWEEVYVRLVAIDSLTQGLSVSQRIAAIVPSGMVYVSKQDWPQYQDNYTGLAAHTTDAGRSSTVTDGPFSFAIDKFPVVLNGSPISTSQYPNGSQVPSPPADPYFAESSRTGNITTNLLNHNFSRRKQLCFQRSFETGYLDFTASATGTYSGLQGSNLAAAPRHYHLVTNLEWFIGSYETPRAYLHDLDDHSGFVSMLSGLTSKQFPCWVYNDGTNFPDPAENNDVAYAYSHFPRCVSHYGMANAIGVRPESVDGVLPRNIAPGASTSVGIFMGTSNGSDWISGLTSAYVLPTYTTGLVLGSSVVDGGLALETDGGTFDPTRISSIYDQEASTFNYGQNVDHLITVRGGGIGTSLTDLVGRYSLDFRTPTALTDTNFRCAIVAPSH